MQIAYVYQCTEKSDNLAFLNGVFKEPYLCIYEIENKEEYLRYAKAHSEIVVEMLENDVNYDLMSGNAGAARILIRLYEITGKGKYLAAAEL